MAINKNDFVKVSYTGTLIEGGAVFDTTDVAVAKQNGIFNEKAQYGALVVPLSRRHLLPGLEEGIVGKEVGKTYELTISAEKAFGKKNAKLIQLMPLSVFKKQKINAFPGLQVNVDGRVATIKTVTGGRCMVDFNHPLSGKDVHYSITVEDVITDDLEKVHSLFAFEFNIPKGVYDVSKEGQTLVITFKGNLPLEQMKPYFTKTLEEVGLKNIEFKIEAPKKVAVPKKSEQTDAKE